MILAAEVMIGIGAFLGGFALLLVALLPRWSARRRERIIRDLWQRKLDMARQGVVTGQYPSEPALALLQAVIEADEQVEELWRAEIERLGVVSTEGLRALWHVKGGDRDP